MHRISRMFWLSLAVATACPGYSAAETYRTMGFPPAHELFPPLVADPTEPRFAFQGGPVVSGRAVAKVNLGDYLGLYRWTFLDQQAAVQFNVGGAVNSRFDATTSHALQVIDYYGNVPMDVAWGPWAARFLFYHDSSHLGDDYLREKNIQSVDTSWEALRGILSVQPWKAVRFYGGYTHAVHSKPAWSDPNAVQGGIEIYFNNSDRVHWHPYFATDVQSWGRSAWNPTVSTELGIKTGGQNSRGRGISYFTQMTSGPRYEGQFYAVHETIYTVGLKFQLSQAPAVPATAPPAAPPTP